MVLDALGIHFRHQIRNRLDIVLRCLARMFTAGLRQVLGADIFLGTTASRVQHSIRVPVLLLKAR